MKFYSSILCLVVLSSCIKDDLLEDFVEPEIRVTAGVDSLSVDSLFQGVALYFNNVGEETKVNMVWSSSNESVATVDGSNGLIKGISQGTCKILVKYTDGETSKTDSFDIFISNNVVVTVVSGKKSGTVATTSTYPLSGSYTLETQGDDLLLTLSDDYAADNSLPGLYIYLSNNSESNDGGVALEIGAVSVFTGAHSYLIPDVGINDFSFVLYFCKPFGIKVGHGEIPSN
jgi:hypothetical protein